VIATGVAACAPEQPAASPSAQASPQQGIIDRSAQAIETVRASDEGRALDESLKASFGVLVFPRLIKAGFVLGGEGGNGVLVTRGKDGSFSAPAFYSIGGGSVGLQIGYQETSVVLVLMSEKALLSAIERGITLGTDVTVAAGTIGGAGESHRTSAAADVYSFAVAKGVFAGLSLDGAVISARASHNQAYYGAAATTRGIVLERSFDQPGTAAIKAALGPR